MSLKHNLICQVLCVALILAIQANAQEDVDGYTNLGRGSCQDVRGKGYSYLQRMVKFPNAETCGKQECERFGNMEQYRGYEYSVAQRCTCLFDIDEIPAVPNDPNDPTYIEKKDSGNGPVGGISGTPGAWCYKFGVSSCWFAISSLFIKYFFLANLTKYMTTY